MPSFSQIFQRVQPDGSVIFDFQGHIHATGLDLDAVDMIAHPVGAGIPTVNTVGWIRQSDGARIANIWGGYQSPTQNTLRVEIRDTDGVIQGQTLLTDTMFSNFHAADNSQILQATGPWATTGPPDATSGISFTLGRNGNVLFFVVIGGWSPSGTSGIKTRHYIDGINLTDVGVNPSNVVNAHQTYFGFFVENLAVGTHWWWAETIAGTSDNLDSAQLLIIQ